MFNSEPLPEPADESAPPSGSCPVPVFFQYGFVILFNWGVNIMKPFKIYPRSSFSSEEIRGYWIENKLETKWRIKKLKPLHPLSGQKVSLFAKVEDGKH